MHRRPGEELKQWQSSQRPVLLSLTLGFGNRLAYMEHPGIYFEMTLHYRKHCRWRDMLARQL